ncbi:hypothetical protein RUND412_008954 [Rhizina undulata]
MSFFGISKRKDVLILVMGMTGVGKSSFISAVTGQNVKKEHKLQSSTQELELGKCRIGDYNVTFVDTPGFDNIDSSDADILQRISTYLEYSYNTGLKLTGIIYMHRITDSRVSGSTMKNFRMFQALCGENNMPNVSLATSMWDNVSETEGLEREKELIVTKNFWGGMIAMGAKYYRWKRTKESAIGIASPIVHMPPIVLLLQEELKETGNLAQTSAGRQVQSDQEKEVEKPEEERKIFFEQIQEATRTQNAAMMEESRKLYEEKMVVLRKANEDLQKLVMDRGDDGKLFLKQMQEDNKAQNAAMLEENRQLQEEQIAAMLEESRNLQEEQIATMLEKNRKLHEEQIVAMRKVNGDFQELRMESTDDGKLSLQQMQEDTKAQNAAILEEIRKLQEEQTAEIRKLQEKQIAGMLENSRKLHEEQIAAMQKVNEGFRGLRTERLDDGKLFLKQMQEDIKAQNAAMLEESQKLQEKQTAAIQKLQEEQITAMLEKSRKLHEEQITAMQKVNEGFRGLRTERVDAGKLLLKQMQEDNKAQNAAMLEEIRKLQEEQIAAMMEKGRKLHEEQVAAMRKVNEDFQKLRTERVDDGKLVFKQMQEENKAQNAAMLEKSRKLQEEQITAMLEKNRKFQEEQIAAMRKANEDRQKRSGDQVESMKQRINELENQLAKKRKTCIIS